MATNDLNTSKASNKSILDAERLLDVNKLVAINKVQPPYPERKDGWITKTALAIVAGTALASILALVLYPMLWQMCDESGTCQPAEPPAWAAEMLRLTLVSSLAFVMGASTNSNNS
ncbi:hypothetical protein [Marivivens marinus]|uniref:hypothetical protein n=1 Tax=Marivivens marinus TaxID=3110173 RepID=UPI003B84A1E8